MAEVTSGDQQPQAALSAARELESSDAPLAADPASALAAHAATEAAPAAAPAAPSPALSPAASSPALSISALRDVLAWGGREADALARSNAVDAPQVVDTRVRLALMLADLGADGAWAAHLDNVASHPMGPGLLLSHAIYSGQGGHIHAARDAIASPSPVMSAAERTRRATALGDVAEVWLYRFGDAAAAADAAHAALALLLQSRQAGAPPGGQERAASLGRELRHVHVTALAVAERWRELGDALVEVASLSGAEVTVVAEAAHVLLDRLDDSARAATLLGRFGGTKGSASLATLAGPGLIHGYRALVLALDVAGAQARAAQVPSPIKRPVSPLDTEAIERQRLAMLASAEGAGREAAAIELLLAQRISGRDPAAALEICLRLAESGLADQAGGAWGPHLAALIGYSFARSTGDWNRAIIALRQLAAHRAAGVLSAAYAWRAAELLDARLDDRAAALAAWQSIPEGDALADEQADEQIERARERLLLAGNPEQLVADLEVRARGSLARGDDAWRLFCLRRAAALAESRLTDLARAAALQSALVDAGGGVPECEHLARLYRRLGDREAQVRTYHALIEKARDPRVGTACLCAIGAIEWASGRMEAAEEAFSAAARQAPRDAISRLALAALYRATDRRRELVTVLARLVELVADRALLVELLRELGLLYASEFNNARRARETLERALELAPEDAATLHAMAQVHERNRQWGEAIELHQRALQAVAKQAAQAGHDGVAMHPGGLPFTPAAVWMEIGAIEEKQRKNDDAALRAYLQAQAAEPSLLAALQAQEAIYRRQGKTEKLLELLHTELALGPDPARRVQIQLDIAALSNTGGDEGAASDVALAAYEQALEVDPGNPTALAGIERIGRAEGRWSVIAKAFRAAPRTAAHLAVLAEALAELESWHDLAEVQILQIAQAATTAEKGRLSHELAENYYRRLGDVERAAAAYRQAIAHGGDTAPSRKSLMYLLAEHERWQELEETYVQELALVDEHDEARAGLLMRLGALRRDHLGRLSEAAHAYEEALEEAPPNIPALEALADIYERLASESDLLRVLSAHAAATEDAHERCKIYRRIGDIKQAREDVDGAIIAYRQAFEAEPGNRVVFTEMEKLCYRFERWNDAMALYNNAIERVEGGLQRAYRLGDLYARRGQVQLQYLKQLDAAATSYRRVIELDPDNDTAVKYLDSILSQKEDWTELIDTYQTRAQLSTDDEKRAESLRRAARIAGNKLKDPVEAARIYERLLDVSARDDEALDILERFYDRRKDWEHLVGVLERRLSASPAEDSAAALLRRIAQVCEEGLRDPKRAIDNYRRILEISPGNKDALEALGRIYESTELWTEFIDVTRRQIRVTSDRNIKALLYFKCGSVMEAKFGKEEDAIRYYDAAIKTSPSCLPAVHGLRDLYRRREDWLRVIQTLELEVKLWQDKKERAGVSAQIGRIYAEHIGDIKMALHYYESALAIDPDCLPANQALFEHYFENEDWEQAKPLAQALVQKAMREGDPQTRSEFYRRHGIVNFMTGEPRAGAESLVIALEILPTNREALDALGKLAKAHPDAYTYEDTYRELEKIYKKRDDAQPLLARVRVAQARGHERDGDLDRALALYEEATAMCPADLTVLSALVDFHCAVGRFADAVAAIDRFLRSDPPPTPEDRVHAMMRQAEIHADHTRSPERAIEVLRAVIALEPTHQDAHYHLAQELYALNRFQDALAAIEHAIEQAAAPGKPVLPQILSRYYYYFGRIVEATGDSHRVGSHYRRAAEYDPAYAPPILALARRAMEQNDRRQAESLLINAAHAAMEHSGVEAAVPLQRGLARILLLSGARQDAIEAYRGILNVRPDATADRYALAEIYAVDDVPRAVAELTKILLRDIHHAPTYHLLGKLLLQSGELERAVRNVAVTDLLGFSAGGERSPAAEALAAQPREPLRRPVTDELRQRVLVTPAAHEPAGEVFAVIAAQVTTMFPKPPMGDDLVPVQRCDDPAFAAMAAVMAQIYCVEPEVYVGRNVPGGITLVTHPRRIVVFDRTLIAVDESSRRFLLGWAFDAIRGEYALLFHLRERQRSELGNLLRSLLGPEAERPALTNELIQTIPKSAVRVIDQYAGRGLQLDSEAWIDGMLAMARRAGLFACDDLQAATRMIARLNGELIEPGPGGAAGLGAVLCGADLIRFFLSEEYHRLREVLIRRESTPGG
jgi:tetratricopeptide (TPR) repeat protein